jgi:hypothetical protein
VVERWRLVPVYEKVGVIGLMVTLSVPTEVPEGNPVVVLLFENAIDDIVWLVGELTVIVSAWPNDELVAPA